MEVICMTYAVVLYFDVKTELYIQNLMNHLCDKGMNTYMLDNKIPPHVTISLFDKYNTDGLVNIIKKFADSLKSFELCFASIGVFYPPVIFLAPVIIQQLLEANSTIINSLKEVATDFNDYYMPGTWVPHAALGVKLSENELQEAFKIVQKEFKTFSGIITKVALAECNPYKELCCYDL